MTRTCAALLLAVTLIPATAGAQPRRFDPLSDKLVLTLPGTERVSVREGVVYARTDSGALAFDLYLPATPAATPPPVVLFVNGVGDRPGIGMRRWGGYRDWARLAAARGLAAIVHDTRIGKTREDPAALLAWLRREGKSVGIDGENVIVWCSSANTTSGWPMAQDPANDHVRGVVVYYGAPDTTLNRVDLPILLVRAGLDSPVFNVALDGMAARALRADAPVTVLNLPNAHHAFDVLDDDDQSRAAITATLDWMVAQASPGMRSAQALRRDELTARRLAARQRWAEAEPHIRAWLAASPDDLHGAKLLADCLYGLRRFAEAGDAYAKCGDGGLMQALTWYNAACSYALAGQKERALAYLEKSVGSGAVSEPSGLRRDPDFASLAGDPRFEAMAGPRTP